MPLSEARETQVRIFDPFAYRVTMQERFVQVTMGEAFSLANLYPIVWKHNEIGDLKLVAVRSLRNDRPARGLETRGLSALPLLLQAFPFRFRNINADDFEIGLERTAPERERDQGSYIYNHDGTFLPGAELKIAALEGFRANYAELLILSENLRHNDMLEPLVLPEDVISDFQLPPFFAAREDIDLQLACGRLGRSAWASAVHFLASQRLSLYRMSGILRVAKEAS